MSKSSIWRVVCISYLVMMSLILIVFLGQFLVVRLFVNLNNIAFLKSLKSAQGETFRFGLGYREYLKNPDVRIPTNLFEQALSIDDKDFGARWGLGRILLAQNRAEEAAIVLQPLASTYAQQPLFFLDLLKAYRLAGWEEEIYNLGVDGWENIPESILCRLDWGNAIKSISHPYKNIKNSRSELSIAPEYIEFVNRNTPLRQQVACMKWMLAKEDSLGFIYSINNLKDFGLPALFFLSGTLSLSDLDMIPYLVHREIWPRPMAQRVISWLVWRYYSVDALDGLLLGLMESNPMSYIWSFYYGEYLHRRGNWEKADIAYRHALELSPGQPEILLHLGLVNETLGNGLKRQPDRLEQARDYYEAYLHINDGDLLAGKFLQRVYKALGESLSDQMGDMVASKTDLVGSVARLLGVDPKYIHLKSDLSQAGDFNQWQVLPSIFLDKPTGWHLSKWRSLPSGLIYKPQGWSISDLAQDSRYNQGAFVCGPDSLYAWEGLSARLDGIWLGDSDQVLPGNFGVQLRGQQEQGIDLESHSPYVLSFFYRTRSNAEELSIWSSYTIGVLLASTTSDRQLPPTNGQWWRFVAVAWNKKDSQQMVMPILRTWTTGGVWVDQFQISQVLIDDEVDVIDDVFRITIEKMEMGK